MIDTQEVVVAMGSGIEFGRTREPLYLDIETVPDDDRAHLFDMPPLPEPLVEVTWGDPVKDLIHGTQAEIERRIAVHLAGDGLIGGERVLQQWICLAAIGAENASPKPRKGVKDIFAKMLEAIAGDEKRIADAKAARRKEMSLCPEMCRIVAVGCACGNGAAGAEIAHSLDDEGRLLNSLWIEIARGCPLVGYNIIGFDLPVIFARSMLHGIEPTRRLDLRSWGGDVVDLMQLRFSREKPRRLKWLANAMGIQIEAEGVDGSQVEELYNGGDEGRARLAEYVRSDVEITRELHGLYSGFYC